MSLWKTKDWIYSKRLPLRFRKRGKAKNRGEGLSKSVWPLRKYKKVFWLGNYEFSFYENAEQLLWFRPICEACLPEKLLRPWERPRGTYLIQWPKIKHAFFEKWNFADFEKSIFTMREIEIPQKWAKLQNHLSNFKFGKSDFCTFLWVKNPSKLKSLTLKTVTFSFELSGGCKFQFWSILQLQNCKNLI